MPDRNANEPPTEVLLIDDDEADARLIAEAFKQSSGRDVRLEVLSDAAEALSSLHGQPGACAVTPPALIILDLNLPKYDGRQFLRDIKADENLCRIPVVVFTTSSAEAEVVLAYQAHANCYICKPTNLKGFLAVIQSIKNFWFSVAALPSR